MSEDWSEALAWAGSTIGSPVTGSHRLEGGMTSAMLALRHENGTETVLRLITEQPWRDHGPALSTRERDAQTSLAQSAVPAPVSLGLDADGASTGVSAHLMSRLPGEPRQHLGDSHLQPMADLLAAIHAHRPQEPFRTFQTWAWPDKWVVPAWSRHPEAWAYAFEMLAAPAPAYEPTFLHRDFGHRNLLWDGDRITGVVDWVETSTGPAWLDAAHAASNLAIAVDADLGERFLQTYATTSAAGPAETYWLVMDAVGYLPPPGKSALFGTPEQSRRLDEWLGRIMQHAR